MSRPLYTYDVFANDTANGSFIGMRKTVVKATKFAKSLLDLNHYKVIVIKKRKRIRGDFTY